MKSILLHAEDDDCMAARQEVAMDLARAHNGHITCLQAVNYEFFAPGDFYGSAMAAAIPQIKKAAEDFRARIEADLSNEDVQWEWQLMHGMAETKLLEQSPLHDIILVGPHDVGQHNRGPSSMVGELVLKAPVPVLVIPGETKRIDPKAPIMVAWNGSAEACVALRSAVPILGTASKVILASVAEKSDHDRFDFPPVEGGKYLSRHGIKAELVDIERGDQRISDVLYSAALEHGCSMMVMGAFGHSRLAEFLLGGVTRRALSSPKLPVFLAH
ncbi:MAG: universal stress protein [Pseudomonadota bacterium]|nr:universal stress protein [Pseudomonadota bacterium]